MKKKSLCKEYPYKKSFFKKCYEYNFFFKFSESVLSNPEWFFNEEDDLDEEESGPESSSVMSPNARDTKLSLVRLTDNESDNHQVLLSNLQKLEDSGKIQSKDVSAKDIVSGIISAANRKMLRSQNKVSSSSKKDSVGSSETSKSNQKLDAIDANNHKVVILL